MLSPDTLPPPQYVLAVCHPVADLAAAESFLVAVLGFTVKARGEQVLEVENGALTVRLVLNANAAAVLELELVTSDLEASMAFLALQPGVEATGGLSEVGAGRFERRYLGPQGIGICLVRQLSAEEMGLRPPLPTSLAWEATASELAQQVLAFVPWAFRIGALRRTAERAELLAVSAGEVEVVAEHCIRALLEVTPDFQQERLRAELRLLGVEPGRGNGRDQG